MKVTVSLFLVMMVCVGCGTDTTRRIDDGNRLHNRGAYQSAVRAYQSAQVGAPDQPEAYYNAASSLLALDEYLQAIEVLEQALLTADDALKVQAYYNLGNVYFEMGLFLDAVTAYQEALLLNPEDDDARYNLELALQRYVAPTPTAIEQQTNPELGQSDPNVTPTNQPGGLDGPTPTPPPQEAPPDPSETPVQGDVASDGIESSTPIPDADGELTIEQAEQLLESIEQNQEALSQFLEEEAVSGEPFEKDW